MDSQNDAAAVAAAAKGKAVRRNNEGMRDDRIMRMEGEEVAGEHERVPRREPGQASDAVGEHGRVLHREQGQGSAGDEAASEHVVVSSTLLETILNNQRTMHEFMLTLMRERSSQPSQNPEAEETHGTQEQERITEELFPNPPTRRRSSITRTEDADDVQEARAKTPRVTPQADNEYVTREDLKKLLDSKKQMIVADIDFRPPYPQWVAMKSYPTGYTPPKFRKFDGKTGHAREHVMCFIDDLGIFGQDKELRLREFSKSLTGKAYTWYSKLAPESVPSWEEMVTAFCGKFLESHPIVHIMDLGRVKQHANEDAVTFVKRYRDLAVECKEPMAEADLVYGCVSNMSSSVRLFLEQANITTFSELIERAKKTVSSIRKVNKSTSKSEGAPLMTVAVVEDQQPKPSSRQGVGQYNQVPPPTTYDKKETRPPTWRGRPPPPYPCSMEDVYALLEVWVKDGHVQLPQVRRHVTEAERKSGCFCVYHQSTTHPTEDCYQLRQIFQTHYKNGEFEATVQTQPLPAHAVLGAGPLMIEELKEIGEVETIEEDDYAVVAKGLVMSTNFRAFFDLLEFDEEAKMQAAISIAEIAKNMGAV